MENKLSTESSSNAQPVERALLVELDNIAFHIRKIMLNTFARVLAGKDIPFSQQHFVKYFLETPPLDGLAALLKATGKQRLSKEKLLADMEVAVKTDALENEKINPGFVALAKASRERGWPIGAITCLDSETSSQMLEKAGISKDITVVLSCGNGTEKHFPTSDVWLRLVRQLSVGTRRCCALVSCSLLAQSAMACGMRVFAIPDEITSFNDFGGCDAVFEKFEEATAKQIVDLVSGR